MFYGQCWECGERWALGTASTCTCVEEPTRVNLTDEEIWDLWVQETTPERRTREFVTAFARVIEAKLKEKGNG